LAALAGGRRAASVDETLAAMDREREEWKKNGAGRRIGTVLIILGVLVVLAAGLAALLLLAPDSGAAQWARSAYEFIIGVPKEDLPNPE
jgi:hypothetical protein